MIGGIGYFLFFLVAFLTLTILLIWPVFPYVVLAILFAYLSNPINKWMQRYVRSAGVRAGILTLGVLLVFALPLVFAIQRIYTSVRGLELENARRWAENVQIWLINHNLGVISDGVFRIAGQARDFALSSFPSLFGSVFGVSLGIFVCLFVFYYFSKEGEQIWRGFLDSLPLPGKLTSDLSREVTGIVRAIMYGQFLTALIQGAAGGLGLLVFHVPQALVLTITMMLVGMIPFLGTVLVWGPAGVIKLATGHVWEGAGLLIYGVAIVMNLDNLLRPRLIAMHSQVHPVVILIGIIGGTKVFGFIGVVVGPLIFAIFLQLVRYFGHYHPGESDAAPRAG